MKTIFLSLITVLFLFIGCDELKKLPTNTSGGIFSLNGSWQLTSTNDNNSLSGSVVTVFPGIADGSVKSLSNNNLCLRQNDILWKGVKSTGSGAFSFTNLVDACNSQVVYKAATITVLTNDEIRITGQNNQGKELIQSWKRIAAK